MEVEIEPIERPRRVVLDALFELYAHDFSAYVPLVLQESGRFEVHAGDGWWTEAGHHPYFVRADGRLAGFALVRRGSRVNADPEVMDVAEFFVVRGERRKHVGRYAAARLFARFPGPWEVRVRQANARALQFWTRVLPALSATAVRTSTYRDQDVDWTVLRADARPLA